MKKYLITAIFLYFFSFLPAFAAQDQWEIVTPPGTSGVTFNTVSVIDNYIFLGTDNGFYRSTTTGATWEQVNTGLTNINVTSIAVGWSSAVPFSVTPSSYVFIGTPAGVFRNTLEGDTWTEINVGLNDLDIRDLEWDQLNLTTNLYAATASTTGPNGVYKSLDNGDTWTQTDDTVLLSDPIVKITSDFGDLVSGYLYALSSSNQIYSTILPLVEPEVWTNITPVGATTTNNINASNANGGYNWLSTNDGVYYSDGLGINWTAKNNGVTDLDINHTESIYDPANANIVYSASNGGGVYKSTDTGDTWTQINPSPTDLNIKEIKNDPNRATLVYAISNSQVYILDLSDPLLFPTPDTTAPDQITPLSITETGTNSVVLEWLAPGDDGAIGTSTSYDLRYSTATITDGNWASATQATGEPAPQIVGSSASTTVTGLLEGTTYYFAIKASDEVLNTSALSPNVSATTNVAPDTTAPTVPASLTATTTTSSLIGLSWASSTDAIGVSGYRIYKNGSQLATTTNIFYTDSGLLASTSYSYFVDAYDAMLNYSATSTTYSTSTLAVTIPTNLTATTTTPTIIGLSWTSTGATGYRVYRGGTQLATTTNNYYTNTGLTPSTSYSYFVDAYDSVFNYSATSTTHSTSTIATPTCTSWTYSGWGSCQSNGTRTRTITSSLPSECANGSPLISEACTYSSGSGSSGGGSGGGGFIDSVAPVRSLATSETSSPFTGIVALKLATNEIATCRYLNLPGRLYSAMITFNETNQSVHKTAVSGLELNKTYTYYIKCQDPSGNTNYDDLRITFSPSTTATSSSAAQLLSLQSTVSAQIISTSTATTTITYLPILTGPFSFGLISPQVKVLQQYLSQESVIYSEKILSGVYNATTTRAVEKFQCKYLSICSSATTGYGTAGPKTRAKLMEMYYKKPAVLGATTTVTTKLTGPLSFGLKSNQVKSLQQLLATDKEVYPEGTVTGYYGNLTVKAVQRFQCKHLSICSSATAGYGTCGPKTKAKLNELFNLK